MNKKFENKKGFSIIEIMVVIAILSIVIGAAVMGFGKMRSRALLEEGQASLLNILELAKNRAASGFGSTSTNHGVRIGTNEIIIFEGDDFNTATNKTTTTLPSSISINVSSPFDIIFGRISATSSTSTTIQISHPPSGATTSVRVEQSGLISTP